MEGTWRALASGGGMEGTCYMEEAWRALASGGGMEGICYKEGLAMHLMVMYTKPKLVLMN